MNIKRNTPDMILEARAIGRGRHWALELLVFLLVMLVASFLQSIPTAVGAVVWLFTGSPLMSYAMDFAQTGDVESYMQQVMGITADGLPAWFNLLSLFSTVLLTLTAILYCRWIEKRGVRTMGFRRENALREYGLGALIGAGLISLAIVLAWVCGALRFVRGSFHIVGFLLALLGFILQGMSEEALCRGYLMVSISRRYPLWLAVLLSSLAFAALHLLNPGISPLAFLNLVLAGAVFAVYVLRRGDLWGACAMHSLWNFVQGNVFGVSVSGTGLSGESSLLSAAPVGSMALLNGGAFGIEGGLCVTLVLTLALLALLFLVPGCPNAPQKTPPELTEE